MKVFVDTDSDIRLIRRLKRDISQRGRNISGIIKQYNKFVKPAFEQYIEPTVQSADIVVPRGECGLDWYNWDSSLSQHVGDEAPCFWVSQVEKTS